MIEIKIIDKNGVELNDGDTVKYVSMKPYYQDEEFLSFQSGVVVKYEQYKINAESEINKFGMFSIPFFHYEKDDIVNLFQCEKDNQEEYEAVLLDIASSLGFEFTNEDDLFKRINGLEVLK